MQAILIRAGCFLSIIVLGFVLRRIGVFGPEAFPVLSKVVMKVTLPAAIVSSFVGKEIDPTLLVISLLGFGGSFLYMVLGYVTNLRRDRRRKAYDILNLPGYNIGNFTLPFVQSFLGPMGVITASLFDVGNAVVLLGGSFSVASMIQDGTRFSLKRLVSTLLKSVPFVTYMIVVALSLLRISIPQPVGELAGIIGGANAFLAMFMVGVGFKLEANRTQIARIVQILGIRYGMAIVLALCFYFLLPFELAIRQALVILAFSPIGSAVPPFTEQLKGDVGLSSALNSISMVLSIPIIVALLVILL